MKKYSIILLSIIFIIFCGFVLLQTSKINVLEVFSPNEIGVDFNKNGKLDELETVLVKNVEPIKLNSFKSLNITEEEALELQYLSTKFAENILKNKKIRIKNEEIIFENQNYAEKYNISAFALKNGKPINKEIFGKELQKIRQNPLRIYNNRSHKYHRLTCKYGQISRDSVVLTQSQLLKDAQACKFCSFSNNKKIKNKVIKQVPLICSNGSEKLFLTDFTMNLKPNSDCKSSVCKELLNQINSAKSTIDIAIYGYDNIPLVTTALKDAVNRGVNVRLVYDKTSRNQYSYDDTKLLTDFIKQNNSDFFSKSNNFIMHNKFYIFDNKRIMTGSANLSKTDMAGFNSNTVVLVESEKVANIYTKEFEQMFSGKFHTEKMIKPEEARLNLGNSIVSVYFSPQSSTVKAAIIPLINNSKNYIYVSSFLITHDSLAKSFLNAKSRKVDVKIILDATNINQKRSKAAILRQNGIAVKCENYAGKMHSKTIVIDDKYLILGSMNFSNSGENKNDENVLIIENPEFAKVYRIFFQYIWQKIPEKYLKYSVGAESKGSIGSCSDGVDNDYDGKIDMQDEGCQVFKK